MTNEEAIKTLKDMISIPVWDIKNADAVERAIKSLEQEPCEDCISRQSAIFLANDLKEDLPDDEHIANMVLVYNEGILEYQTKLSLLPPVTPQPKTDALDKIRAEIDRQQKWLLQAGCTTYNVDIAFDAIKTVVAEKER